VLSRDERRGADGGAVPLTVASSAAMHLLHPRHPGLALDVLFTIAILVAVPITGRTLASPVEQRALGALLGELGVPPKSIFGLLPEVFELPVELLVSFALRFVGPLLALAGPVAR